MIDGFVLQLLRTSVCFGTSRRSCTREHLSQYYGILQQMNKYEAESKVAVQDSKTRSGVSDLVSSSSLSLIYTHTHHARTRTSGLQCCSISCHELKMQRGWDALDSAMWTSSYVFLAYEEAPHDDRHVSVFVLLVTRPRTLQSAGRRKDGAGGVPYDVIPAASETWGACVA